MILTGDCLEKLRSLENNSVDSIVTDPPYGLSFMGKKWDYDVPSIELWREVLRVLKPGGHLLSFGGTRTYHRMVVNIEDAGFEIRDQIQWIYGSGFPKSHNIKDGDFKGWGTALKPANEPIVVARKPLEKGLTVAENVMKWGCGALNIDGTMIATEARTQLSGKGSNANCFGEYGKGEMVTVSGRWPANIIFDEAAAEMLDAQSLKNVKMHHAGNKKNKVVDAGDKSIFGIGLHKGLASQYQDESLGASRFFYVAKASKSERNAGLEGMPEKPMNTYNFSEDGSFTKNSTAKSGNQVRESRQNHHPTVKPVKLMQYLVRLVTPPKGTVLDPFCGSGTTGVACKREGFKFIGIEREAEYVAIAKRRLVAAEPRQLEIA